MKKIFLDGIVIFDNISDNLLIPGMVDSVELRILFELTNFNNKKINNAIFNHLVVGNEKKKVCMQNEINEAYFTQRVKCLNRTYQLVRALMPFYIKGVK